MPALKYAYTTLFGKSYRNLSAEDQRAIDEAITRLREKPFYPFPNGLRVHKLGGVTGTAVGKSKKPPPVWEMHASMPLLVTFQYGDDEIIFRNCGQHDDVLRSP